MNTDKKRFFKLILNSSDYDSLKKFLPKHGNQEISRLTSLIKQYQETKAIHEQKQDTSRVLSRKIGEAKKHGNAADQLIAEMRSNSEQVKILDDALHVIEDKILSITSPETKQHDTPMNRAKVSDTRKYPEPTFDGSISIALLQQETDAWNRFVANHPSATIYHLADWRDVIHESFGHETYYLYAHDSNGIFKGILPLIRLKSHLFGDFMVSMPYFNYGGAVGNHPQIEEMLVQHANKLAAEHKLTHIEYRDDIVKPDTPVRTDKVNMILPLPSNQDELWKSFSPKLRSQIKRPQREDTEVCLGSRELLNDFYNIFARNMRDLGTPVYSKTFFQNILQTFPKQTRILTIKLGNKPVAGAFLIGHKETMEIPWASTVRSANHLSVNMLMYWEVLCYAIQEKYLYFDFGRSSIDSGTYKFKKQWGAQPIQLYWHYWLNNCELPSLNPSNPKYKIIINIWKKMPTWLTKVIGPMIVKNLP